MPRLYRPHIPLEVRCRVVLRQLGELWINDCLYWHHRNFSGLLADRLGKLATLLGCEVKDLRLDHDPALATRQRKGEGKNTVYSPAANNPEFLIYREKHAHHIKTNVRGDGAQYPDRVLIKRERRRTRPKSALDKWADAKRRAAKRKWPNRLRRSRAKFPWPKGRKIPSRKMR